MKDKGAIPYIGSIVKRNYYPWTEFRDIIIVNEEDDGERIHDDLLEKLYSHNLFYVDYKSNTEFKQIEDTNTSYLEEDYRIYEPHTSISLLHNKKHDNENILDHLFKEHKINDPNIIEEIELHFLETPKINLEHLKNCSNLTSLKIQGNRNLFDIDNIEYIPTKNMRELRLKISGTFDSYIKHIQKMKELDELSLSFYVSDQIDLTPITTSNTKINSLYISANYNKEKVNIKQLYKLKNLEHLFLYKMHNIDFHSLSNLEKLSLLWIETNEEIETNKFLPLFHTDVEIVLNNVLLTPEYYDE